MSQVMLGVGIAIGCVINGVGVGFSYHVDKKIKARGYLCAAAGMTMNVVVCLLVGNTVGASAFAAFAAWWLWCWWNSGGGDGFRKAWKKVKSWVPGLSPAPQGA